MIIKLIGPDSSETHFDVQDRKCGYAAQLVMWNHEIYTLVTAAICPLPTYVRLAPIPKIDSKWHCPAPEKTTP